MITVNISAAGPAVLQGPIVLAVQQAPMAGVGAHVLTGEVAGEQAQVLEMVLVQVLVLALVMAPAGPGVLVPEVVPAGPGVTDGLGEAVILLDPVMMRL